MKIVILTSTSLRHKYIASMVAKEATVELIVTEKKSHKIEGTNLYDEETKNFIDKHFNDRLKSETIFFREFEEFPINTPIIEVDHNEINGLLVFEKILKVNPYIILLFGTSIIKNPLLDTFKSKIVNLHLGLSPYYKGSATNLFPICFKELECIGATIHLATEKVDDGSVLCQLRPEVKLEDTIHDIGNKVILESGKVLPAVLKLLTDKSLELTKQSGIGRVCRIKDLTPKVMREIYSNFNNDFKKEYILKANLKQIQKPIVEIKLK
jgi:folate-dependent phosphoribosylglycinamide formyltransferase PurN